MRKRPKNKSEKLPEKDKCSYQICMSIKVNNQSGEKPLHFSTISDISHISQVYADKPKQLIEYAVGLQTAIPLAIPRVYR